jgi:WW domain
MNAQPPYPSPPQWERRLDTQTGEFYYIDHANHTSRWEVSVESTVVPSARVPSHKPPVWECRVDAQTGVRYYIDHSNQTSQWEVPRGFAAHEPTFALHPPIHVAGQPVPARQRPYYEPKGFSGPSVGQRSRWERAWDEKTGAAYYIDHANQTSQWHVPEGFVGSAAMAPPLPVSIPQHSSASTPAPPKRSIGRALKNPIVNAVVTEGAALIVREVFNNVFGNDE